MLPFHTLLRQSKFLPKYSFCCQQLFIPTTVHSACDHHISFVQYLFLITFPLLLNYHLSCLQIQLKVMLSAPLSKHVAVTGVTGYIGGCSAHELLSSGYIDHAILRKNTPKRVAHLTSHTQAKTYLELFEAYIMNDESLLSAMSACDIIMHVAPPRSRSRQFGR